MPPTTAKNPAPELPHADDIQLLLARAQQGDLAVLPQLQALLKKRPEIWRSIGDLAKHAEQALLAYCAGHNLLLQESVRQRLAELKAEVGAGGASPLDTLLVDRVALTWLQLSIADNEAIRALSRGPAAMPSEEVVRKRQESAQRQFLQAVKTLAIVRKLLRPAVSPLQVASRVMAEGLVGRPRTDRERSRRSRAITGRTSGEEGASPMTRAGREASIPR